MQNFTIISIKKNRQNTSTSPADFWDQALKDADVRKYLQSVVKNFDVKLHCEGLIEYEYFIKITTVIDFSNS